MKDQIQQFIEKDGLIYKLYESKEEVVAKQEKHQEEMDQTLHQQREQIIEKLQKFEKNMTLDLYDDKRIAEAQLQYRDGFNTALKTIIQAIKEME